MKKDLKKKMGETTDIKIIKKKYCMSISVLQRNQMVKIDNKM